MASPSFAGWWIVYAVEDGQPVAFVREVNMLRRTEKLWHAAGVKVRSKQADDDVDIQRLRRGEEVLNALMWKGLEVTRC